jgi:DNA mismatch repair protein MutH
LKWKYKVGTCIVAYCVQWLLNKHLKKVHGLVVEKAKPKRPSTSKGSPQHQDHAKMNAHILGMPWLCKGKMIKKLLIILVPKPSANGISW